MELIKHNRLQMTHEQRLAILEKNREVAQEMFGFRSKPIHLILVRRELKRQIRKSLLFGFGEKEVLVDGDLLRQYLDHTHVGKV